jgi:hypothetical protein
MTSDSHKSAVNLCNRFYEVERRRRNLNGKIRRICRSRKVRFKDFLELPSRIATAYKICCEQTLRFVARVENISQPTPSRENPELLRVLRDKALYFRSKSREKTLIIEDLETSLNVERGLFQRFVEHSRSIRTDPSISEEETERKRHVRKRKGLRRYR